MVPIIRSGGDMETQDTSLPNVKPNGCGRKYISSVAWKDIRFVNQP